MIHPPLNVSVVTDEPGRHIVMGEVGCAVLCEGSISVRYHYYGRKNEGDWVDLKPLGNRIPDEW